MIWCGGELVAMLIIVHVMWGGIHLPLHCHGVTWQILTLGCGQGLWVKAGFPVWQTQVDMVLASLAGLGVNMLLVYGLLTWCWSLGCWYGVGDWSINRQVKLVVACSRQKWVRVWELTCCDTPCETPLLFTTTHILSILFQSLLTSLDEGSGMWCEHHHSSPINSNFIRLPDMHLKDDLQNL